VAEWKRLPTPTTGDGAAEADPSVPKTKSSRRRARDPAQSAIATPAIPIHPRLVASSRQPATQNKTLFIDLFCVGRAFACQHRTAGVQMDSGRLPPRPLRPSRRATGSVRPRRAHQATVPLRRRALLPSLSFPSGRRAANQSALWLASGPGADLPAAPVAPLDPALPHPPTPPRSSRPCFPSLHPVLLI